MQGTGISVVHCLSQELNATLKMGHCQRMVSLYVLRRAIVKRQLGAMNVSVIMIPTSKQAKSMDIIR